MATPPPAAALPETPGFLPEGGDPKAMAAFEKIQKRIKLQTWIIAGLVGALCITLPFAQPVYLFYAMNPQKQVLRMVGLDMANMTNRAVLAWATTSITEIMTMGFGDIDVRLPQQKIRFTPEGWKSYSKAFVELEIGETFKQHQLVLTTAPSNTPVIVGQGVNADNVYEWMVQMPVVMTYATNNNVTSKKNSIITLEIVRVPSERQSAGIAIQSWHSN